MDRYPLISIIVPTYNNERYIKNCIDSLLSQSYPQFEIIIVNDGSTDGTAAVLSAYENNERITVLHKKNGGVSAARNDGIRAAKGDFITFCDADDRLLPGALEAMSRAFDDDTDMLIGSHQKQWIHTYDEIFPPQTFTADDVRRDFLAYKKVVSLICGKCYRAAVIKKQALLFNETMAFSEDLAFNLRFIDAAERKIKVTNELVYLYYISHSGAHEKVDRPVQELAVISDFYHGKENIPPAQYTEIMKGYLQRLVNRNIFWYGKREAAAAIEAGVKTIKEYITDEAIAAAFPADQAALFKAGQYPVFVAAYRRAHPDKVMEKYRYRLSKTAAKVIEKIKKK